MATWCKELTHLKRPWCWKRLKAGGEGDDRERDVWMASQTQQIWVWASSRSWWWTGKAGMLQSTGSQGVRSDWVTELNWASLSDTGHQYPLHAPYLSGFTEILQCLQGKSVQVWRIRWFRQNLMLAWFPQAGLNSQPANFPEVSSLAWTIPAFSSFSLR